MMTARPGVMPLAFRASTRNFHSPRTWRATALPSMIFAVMGMAGVSPGAKTDDDEKHHADPHEHVACDVELLRPGGAYAPACLQDRGGDRRQRPQHGNCNHSLACQYPFH